MTLWLNDASRGTYKINEDTMTFITPFAGSPILYIDDPSIISQQCWVDDQNIYVGSSNAWYIENYTTRKRLVRNTANGFSGIQGCISDATTVYAVGSTASDNVLRTFNKTTGAFIAQFFTFGSGLNNLNLPLTLTWDGAKIYICDQNNHRILIKPTSDLTNIGLTTVIAPTSHGAGIIRSVTVDRDSIYLGYETSGSNFSTYLAKYDRTTLATIFDIQVFGPVFGSEFIPFGITCDEDFVYVAYMNAAQNGPVVKYDKNLNEISRVITSSQTLSHITIASDRWWNMMFVVPYLQIAGGASSRRYRAMSGLYVPFNSDIL
jgi:hypothetical protein